MLNYTKIGVDIGSYSIKITTIERVIQSDSYLGEFVETYNIPSNEDVFEFTKKCLVEFTKKNSIIFADLHFTLPFDYPDVFLKNIKKPNMDDKTIEKGINFEVGSMFTDLNETGFDGKQLRSNDYKYLWSRENKVEVIDGHTTAEDDPDSSSEDDMTLTLAFMEDYILKALAKFKKVTWKISNIEVQSFTVGRLLDKEDAVFIDFGHNATRVYMYHNSNLHAVEVLNVSGSDIYNSITKLYPKLTREVDILNFIRQNTILSEYSVEDFISINIEEDEEFNHSYNNVYGDASTEDNKVNPLTNDNILEEDNKLRELHLKNLIDSLVNGIKSVIRRFEFEANVLLDDVYYFGELSKFNLLLEYISSELIIDLIPLEFLNKGSDLVIDSAESDINYSSYTLSASSILYNEYKYYNTLNFVKFLRTKIDYSALLIVTVCFTVLVHSGMFVINKSYDRNIKEARYVDERQNATISQLESELVALDSKIEDSKNLIERIDDIKAQKRWFSDVLFTLSNIAPKGVIIDEIHEEVGETVIRGSSLDYSNIGYFVFELEKYGDVNLESVEYLGEEGGNKYLYEIDKGKEYDKDNAVQHTFEIKVNHKQPLLPH